MQGSLLMEMDQRAADLARAREQVKQLVGLAPADSALQVEQVFLEALQYLEHGLAIIHEYIAPHRWIGGGDARDVAEPAGGVFQHFAVEVAAEIVGRADDSVGDEMRQV